MIEIIKADGKAERQKIAAMRERAAAVGADIERTVAAIMADVRANGLTAVQAYSRKLDGREAREISDEELSAAYEAKGGYETGTELGKVCNGLVPIEDVAQVSARLIVNTASMKLRKAEIQDFIARCERELEKKSC